MKKTLLAAIMVLITFIVAISADYRDWESGRLLFGEHISTHWIWADTILSPAIPCTSGMMQFSNSEYMPYDSNRKYIQNAPSWFVNYVKLAKVVTGDSAQLSKARYQLSPDSGVTWYDPPDSSGWWIGKSDSIPTWNNPRWYPVYIPSGGVHIRWILYTTIADCSAIRIETIGERKQ